MSKEEKLENLSRKMDALRIDIRNLIAKHNLGVQPVNEFDGMEAFLNSSHFLSVDGEVWFPETISEIFVNCITKN